MEYTRRAMRCPWHGEPQELMKYLSVRGTNWKICNMDGKILIKKAIRLSHCNLRFLILHSSYGFKKKGKLSLFKRSFCHHPSSDHAFRKQTPCLHLQAMSIGCAFNSSPKSTTIPLPAVTPHHLK